MKDMIVVTNWELVDEDDFYLSKDWANKEEKKYKHIKKLHKQAELFIAYEVPALSYALYNTMDAHKIFIDGSGNKVLDCESHIINNDFEEKWALEN